MLDQVRVHPNKIPYIQTKKSMWKISEIKFFTGGRAKNRMVLNGNVWRRLLRRVIVLNEICVLQKLPGVLADGEESGAEQDCSSEWSEFGISRLSWSWIWRTGSLRRSWGRNFPVLSRKVSVALEQSSVLHKCPCRPPGGEMESKNPTLVYVQTQRVPESHLRKWQLWKWSPGKEEPGGKRHCLWSEHCVWGNIDNQWKLDLLKVSWNPRSNEERSLCRNWLNSLRGNLLEISWSELSLVGVSDQSGPPHPWNTGPSSCCLPGWVVRHNGSISHLPLGTMKFQIKVWRPEMT